MAAAGADASPPPTGSATTADADLEKALYGVHASEQFVEAIDAGLQSRAILFAFSLAFSMSSLLSLDSSAWYTRALFRAFAVLLTISCALGSFALIIAMLTSAKLSRMMARKQYFFGTFDYAVGDALKCLRANGPHWSSLEMEDFLSKRVTAVLTRDPPPGYVPETPRAAHCWLKEDYLYHHTSCRPAIAPLTLVNWATQAFSMSLLVFCGALQVRLMDLFGYPVGSCISLPLYAAFAAAFWLLWGNGTLAEMDHIWNPERER